MVGVGVDDTSNSNSNGNGNGNEKAATDEQQQQQQQQQQVRRITVDMSVSKDGSNFSAGERQLLALARAFLYSRRIIVMDEPTASIDTGTDERIQPLIRESFAGHTLLCIAHRLNTVIGMDRILVLGEGDDSCRRRRTLLLAISSHLTDDQSSPHPPHSHSLQ
jgi:ABC-type multidrug transport system fused ATPase/permease subunit